MQTQFKTICTYVHHESGEIIPFQQINKKYYYITEIKRSSKSITKNNILYVYTEKTYSVKRKNIGIQTKINFTE